MVRTFLRDHLPKRFDVGSGFIIDRLDTVARQTDVIVYDALNCPVYRASQDAAIFPSDNVAAVVEVKSRLDKDQLRLAFENIFETKQLAKTSPPELPFVVNSQTLGCLFAFESAISLDKISEHYYQLIKEHSIGFHIDIILVLDKGIITLMAKPQGFPEWGFYYHEGTGGKRSEGMHMAIGTKELGTDSLDAFLRFILTHLTFFRGMIDHPGFNWESNPAYVGTKMRFLATICLEEDPELKKQKAAKYAEEVRREFASFGSSQSEKA